MRQAVGLGSGRNITTAALPGTTLGAGRLARETPSLDAALQRTRSLGHVMCARIRLAALLRWLKSSDGVSHVGQQQRQHMIARAACRRDGYKGQRQRRFWSRKPFSSAFTSAVGSGGAQAC